MNDYRLEIEKKSNRVYGIKGRNMFSTWFKAANFLKSGKLDLSPVIAHKIKFKGFETGFELMKSGNCGRFLRSV